MIAAPHHDRHTPFQRLRVRCDWSPCICFRLLTRLRDSVPTHATHRTPARPQAVNRESVRPTPMRGLCIGIIVVGWVSAGSAQGPALDSAVHEFRLPSTLSWCGIASVFERLSEQTDALAGLERGSDCFDATTFPHLNPRAPAYDLSGLTVRDILDRMMLVAPGYWWREVNGRAVVRPSEAWNAPQDVLNYEVTAFRIRNATNRDVLAALFKFPSRNGSSQTPFAFEFSGARSSTC